MRDEAGRVVVLEFITREEPVLAMRVVVFGVVAVMVLISWQRVRACGAWVVFGRC